MKLLAAFIIAVLVSCHQKKHEKSFLAVDKTKNVQADSSEKEQAFTLVPSIKVKGVGAASGLIYKAGMLYLISDDSDVLYQYDEGTKELSKISLRNDNEIKEKFLKEQKHDFESITSYKDYFYIFGSGSSPNRNQFVKLHKNNGNLKKKSIVSLYNKLKSIGNINHDDFNIEGVVKTKDTLLLFNRGNGAEAKNGIFIVSHWQNSEKEKIMYYPIKLPMVEHTYFGFTDAVQSGDKIYFLAAAEAVASNFKDGGILGSMIGSIDLNTMTLRKTKVISNEHKFEGLSLLEKNKDENTFLLCEDPDDGSTESQIYKLTLIH